MENTETKILNKREIQEILNVGKTTLSKWDNEKISYELEKNCFKVVSIEKKGRSVLFKCEYQEYSQSNEEHLQEVFKVRDVNNFKDYTKRKIQSIEKEELITRKEICEETNTATTTSERYDSKLIEKGVFSKDGYIYVCVDKANDNQKSIIDKVAYDNFWRKNGAIQSQLKNLGKQYKNNEITSDDYFYIKSVLLKETKGDYIFYKLSKIAVQYDNYLCKMIIESK